MAEKDIVEKILFGYKDVFADIFNGLLFGGRGVILAEDLEDAPLSSAYTHKGKVHEQIRDVAKFWKRGKIRLALCCIENQTKPDADIALRVISYDGAAYRSQMLEKEQKERYPVISIVLYFGEKHWRGAKSLKKRLTIPEELRPFVSDYKVNVFEIAFLTQEQVNLFRSDFHIVADYFANARLNKDYKGSQEQITHVEAFFELVAAITGDRRLEEMDLDALPEGGKDMFSIIDRGEARGIAAGEARGIIRGRAEGIVTGRAEAKAAMNDNIQALLRSGQITEEVASLLLSTLE